MIQSFCLHKQKRHLVMIMTLFGGFFLMFILACGMSSVSKASCNNVSHRPKRIVWGTPLFKQNSYAAVDYYAYLTHGDRFSFVVSGLAERLKGKLPDPTPDSLRCGGSLITLNVVQTACHCVSKWTKLNDTYSQTKVFNGWENWSSVYIGFTLVSEMTEDGLYSTKFIVHEKCAMLMRKFIDSFTHDYGIVVLNQDAKLREPNHKPAPAYTVESLTRMYNAVHRQEAVCLFMGYGAYYWKKPGTHGKASPVLQHGWRVVRSYWYCYWRIYFHHEKHFLKDYGLRYIDVATWICTQFFGQHRAHPLPGDSGSPVTCNNHYLGLVSFKDLLSWKTNVSTDFFSAIVFSQFENAIDYRAKMLAKVVDYVKIKEWPPDKPIHIEGRNDWGPYFNPEDPTKGIWIWKHFDDSGSVQTGLYSTTTTPSTLAPTMLSFSILFLLNFL